MADLAIKGHPTRGKEVIEILEMLGGKSNGNIKGYNDDLYYYIAKDGLIYGSGIKYEEFACNYTIFTLEEFLEKYPFKVGDRVTYRADKLLETQVITNMRWDSNYDCVLYYLDNCNVIKVEDILYIIESPEDNIPTIQDKTTIETMKEDKDVIEHTTEINLNHPCFDGHDKIELIIPENWKFEQRDNKMFGIRKHPQYPKTYAECCDIMHIEMNRIIYYEDGLEYRDITRYDINLLTQLRYFRRLLICRDAYWKIAGEQMGLDKPWKYDMSKNEFSCAISYEYGSIQKCEVRYKNHFLVFPTKEMRDEFYKNFKELIEQCKELL